MEETMKTQSTGTQMQAQEFINLESQHGAHNYHPLDVVIDRAEGVWVYDVEGKRYLDCLAAYSAVNQGHCHPKILRTLEEQARKVTLTSRAFRNAQLPLLCKDLHDLTGFDMMLPMNSGTEAVETAIKVARKWGYKVKGIPQDKAEIIVSVGKGLGSAKNLPMVEELANVLGATLAGSRQAVEAGWLSHEHQVGQTGVTVRPKVYFAIGISGAIQHLVGMETSDCIIAINNDPEAPIFKVANYGLAGDLFQLVPALTKEFSKRMSLGLGR